MGNNGSSSQQQCGSSGTGSGSSPGHLAHDATNRGWTQSFPRDPGSNRHSQHHTQPVGQKVLPEPSNQRLRATNNGCIIQNGGTISGRRPAALTLPHDLNKQPGGGFRGRSTSASNMCDGRRAMDGRHCCYYQPDKKQRPDSTGEIHELKRFGSEPDLRCSPTDRSGSRCLQDNNNRRYNPDTTRERESRYKAKKKYKAPPPPPTGSHHHQVDGSSPDSYNWTGGDQEPDVHPPPRKSRLFKTRAETKKARGVNWHSSSSSSSVQPRRRDEPAVKPETAKWTASSKDQTDRGSKPSVGRDDQRRATRILDGKNTLQRSMSSPEFQAELIQVARRVRDKLNCNGRISGCGSSSPVVDGGGHYVASLDRRETVTRSSEEKRTGLSLERKSEERMDRCARKGDGKIVKEERKKDRAKDQETAGSCANQVEGRLPLRERLEVRERLEKRRLEKNSVDPGRSGSRDHQVPEFPRDHRGTGGSDLGDGRQARDKENSDPRWWRSDLRNNRKKQPGERRWSEGRSDKAENSEKMEADGEGRTEPWNPHPATEKATPKTFYFGMNEPSVNEPRNCPDQPEVQPRLQEEDRGSIVHATEDGDDGKNVVEDISLKLRPTLPKKQLEIPRFSPSAAWRLLSALEAPGPTMSTASEEMPVMFEERIERLSRPPPPPLLALGPRSLHDKSGDSGISGDAGAAIEDSVDVSTNRLKTGTTGTGTRPTWTPQQDLGEEEEEESSSDAGVDSPPPIATPLKFPSSRPHVFSLSLPRDDGRPYLCGGEFKGKDGSAFNSLQKLKRSVSGALGFGSTDLERKRTRGTLDDNWMLSSSAPTSLQLQLQLQHVGQDQLTRFELDLDGDRVVAVDEDGDADDDDDEEEEEEEDEEDRFPVIMKPPSFSYLASGGHVMYLPESNGNEYRAGCQAGRKEKSSSIYKKNGTDETVKQHQTDILGNDKSNDQGGKGSSRTTGRSRTDDLMTVRSVVKPSYTRSCENMAEMRQRNSSPIGDGQACEREKGLEQREARTQPKNSSKGRRFTFQSTVRQIERRRLAEKLSREAEAKERQRKGELEAMRKVEEEFQRKRAREKANIRQQLRLYNMEESLNSLPATWNSSQMTRADPDGAASSTASSPISAPPGKGVGTRKGSVSSDEYHRKRASSSESRHQHQQHEHRVNYRPKYYDWGPDSTGHFEYKQTTVHPKVVCDIPKSSPAFVDANVHTKVNPTSSTPRSDNYRKDFAHGAVQATRSSLASSDSELSQPNTRPQSRETPSKPRAPRSRSASPGRRSEAAASEEDECPVEPVKRTVHDFVLSGGVQPFVREKSYRPISFNPHHQPPPPPIPS